MSSEAQEAQQRQEGTAEQVVLLGEDGRAIGTADKASVHDEHTPLHLAFSCFVVDRSGRLLVTQRARSKRTFPGVWTNSVCGHPGPGESLQDAVRRRAGQELGLELGGVRLVLPRFRYRAVAEDGTVEHEMCPVLVAGAAGDVHPDPAEVEQVQWVPWQEFSTQVLARQRAVSAWCVQEVEQLTCLGPDPHHWTDADPAHLPPAAQWDSAEVGTSTQP